jgi:hypothetical protein
MNLHAFPPSLWENGGVIITDFINLRKGKADKKLGRIYSLSAGRNGKSLTHGGKKIVTLLNKIYTFLEPQMLQGPEISFCHTFSPCFKA